MNPIYKIFAGLLVVLMFSSLASGAGEITVGQQRESTLYAALCAMGLSRSMVIVTANEIVVDYVLPPVRSDLDLALQMQAIFIAAAKVAPDAVLTVIKCRYRPESPPMLVAAVPNDVTQRYIAGAIKPIAFWQMVAINDKDLLEATQRQEHDGLRKSRKAKGGGDGPDGDAEGGTTWFGIFDGLFTDKGEEGAEKNPPAGNAGEKKKAAGKTPPQQKDELNKSVEDLQKSIEDLGNTFKDLFR